MPDQQRRFRARASLVLLALQLAATGLHVVPSLVYPSSPYRTTTRIVAALSGLGPLWVLLFGLTSLLLTVGLLRGRGAHYGHVGCAGVWVFYATGLWFGAFGSIPHGTVLFPLLASFMVVFHMFLASSYNRDAANQPTRGGP